MKAYDKALADFTHTIELDPHYSWSFGKLGAIYYYFGDKAQAVAHWHKALSIWENAVETPWESQVKFLENKTLALLGIGRIDEALIVTDELIKRWRPSSEAEFYVYELLSEAHEPPEGLEQLLEKIQPLIDA